jgi:hypothetical protein
LEDAAIDEEAFASCFDQVFGAGDGAGCAEKSEFGHRGVILQKLAMAASGRRGKR